MNEKVGSIVRLATTMSSLWMALIGSQYGHGCATERVDTQRQAGIAYCIDVDDVPQVVDVRQNEIVLVRRRCLDRGRVRALA